MLVLCKFQCEEGVDFKVVSLGDERLTLNNLSWAFAIAMAKDREEWDRRYGTTNRDDTPKKPLFLRGTNCKLISYIAQGQAA